MLLGPSRFPIVMLAGGLCLDPILAQQPTAPVSPPMATGAIARFDLGRSPIGLVGDARQGVYLSAVGRRSIAMGTEDGRFEIWSWPIKWLHDFSLSFRVPKYTAPIPGRDVARSVETRPEGVTITYAYETFTVKQHVFVPLDQPAVVMLLEVDALRPMEVIASFTPDIHYAWPASLGGQYLVWNQDAKAFLFSESRRKVNAFLGSPAVIQASDVPAHQLTAAPPQLVIGVGGSGERYVPPVLGEPPGKGIDAHVAFIPIVLVGGEMSRDSVLAMYRSLTAPGGARREWERRVAHADSLRATLLSLHSPDSLLDRAVEWAKVGLDEAMVCNPDLGCGLVAGYGLSGGASDRPGFGWFFGGDASINSFAMSGAGQLALVRDGAFRFFARYQRADGKITHEISQGAGHIDWFGAYPYAFYHGDTTPFWVLAFGEYWRQSADTALVRELWPKLKKAYEWSRATDGDGDGLMENPLAGAGALEVGDLQIGILSDVYMSGIWIASLDRFARMAEAMAEPGVAAEARGIRSRAVATLERKLWLPGLGQYAFAILEGGKVNENLTAWPATAMAFDVLDPEHGAAMAERLATASIMTDWGARPLASTSSLFDPLHYNNGGVWPFVTGFVALGQYRYHNAPAGRFALDAIARTAFDESRGNNPEVISGRLYKPLDTAVPQQFFATSMVLVPLLRGMLGLEVDAPAGTVTFAPHLPPEWDSVRVEQVPVGTDRLGLSVRRTDGGIAVTVRRGASAGRPIRFTFAPGLPLGSAADAPGGPVPRVTAGDVHVAISGPLDQPEKTFTIRYRRGWSVVPPRAAPAIGDRSTALRVVSERIVGGRYALLLQGLGGRSYDLQLRGPSAATVTAPSGVDAVLGSSLDSRGWQNLRVRFPESKGDADGYVTTTLIFSAAGSTP